LKELVLSVLDADSFVHGSLVIMGNDDDDDDDNNIMLLYSIHLVVAVVVGVIRYDLK
jgi:ssRNA-specific RNase YbeY (16S rRNA maturation enzyme)